MPAAAQPTDDQVLRELEELLCEVAAGRPANRAESTRYSTCRSRLIASPVRPALPGFLYQCGSLLRFKDFITLYAPEIDERQHFVRRRLDPCHALLEAPRRSEARPDESPSRHWML